MYNKYGDQMELPFFYGGGTNLYPAVVETRVRTTVKFLSLIRSQMEQVSWDTV